MTKSKGKGSGATKSWPKAKAKQAKKRYAAPSPARLEEKVRMRTFEERLARLEFRWEQLMRIREEETSAQAPVDVEDPLSDDAGAE